MSRANRFDRPGEAFFAASVAGRLVGVCGLNIDPYQERPAVGRLRHLYVLSTARGQGVGDALVSAVIDAARGRFTTLRLATTNPAAVRLYERFGFQKTSEVRCTHVLQMTEGPPPQA